MTQIKTKIIETPKARVLVVDLPEDAKGFAIAKNVINSGNYSLVFKDKHEFVTMFSNKYIGTADWQLLGKLSEIQEEQWKGVVEGHSIRKDKSNMRFKDYRFPELTEYGAYLPSATESGLSLIGSACLLKNPHGEKPQYIVEAETESQASEIVGMAMEWQADEEHVFKNPILFIDYKK